MKFACESCQTKYTIPDEKVRGKVLKIRCKKCGSVITVKEEVAAPPEPEAPPMEERTRVADIGLLEKLRAAENARESGTSPAVAAAPPAAPEPPPGIEWYVMVNGEQVGPLGPDDLRAKADSGEVTDRSHVWRDGMADWKRAGEVQELSQYFAPPPPPPAPKPAPVTRPQSAPRLQQPQVVAPAPVAPQAFAAADDDNVATVARPRPNLDQLFGDVHDAPAPARKLAAAPIGGEDEEPTGGNGAANGHARAPSSNLADLMGDIDASHEPTGIRPVDIGQSGDPFAQVPDAPSLQQPVIGEQTRFFMKKAGVTNRNPWWKYAIFAVVLLATPAAVLYALGSMGVGGMVVVVDESGQEKQVAKYSFENIKSNGLGALLSGQQPQPTAPKKAPKKVAKTDDKKAATPTPDPNPPKANLSDEDKKKMALAGQVMDPSDPLNKTGATGPKERKETKTAQTDQGAEGLSSEVVAKVVAENAPSFNKCVEDKLKRDPSWKGGKINLTVKIGPSGTVIESSIAETKVASDDVGDCIKGRVRRMKFPRFDGDEPQEVQFPLLLANGG